MYFANNCSPSPLAFSTFSTTLLVLGNAACCCGSCLRMAASCRSRSSDEPPQGLNRRSAATRFRTSSVPSAARPLPRGSFMEAKLSFRRGTVKGTKLKLLGIVDVHHVTVQGLALRGRQNAGHGRVAELLGVFELDEKLQQRLLLFCPDVHLQHDLVLRVYRRTNRSHPHVVRKNFFQVRENLSPTDPLAQQQAVQKDAAIERLGVLRFPQHGVQLSLLDGDHPQPAFELIDIPARRSQARALRQVERNQHP